MIIKKEHQRIFALENSRKEIKTPFYFASISSIKSEHKLSEHLKILTDIHYPGFLISSYDIYNYDKQDSLLKTLSEITEGDIFTIIDSGIYESYWKKDKNWSIEKFGKILEKINIDLCFSFDILWENDKNIKKHIKETIKNTLITASMQKLGDTAPIIHLVPKNSSTIVRGVVEGINPQIIAIAERDLGTSIFERAESIKKIRNVLDKMKRDIPIHVLGTGDPISILVYVLSGADTFDSLDWFNHIINPSNGQLYNFNQKDMIKCNCKACKLEDTIYGFQVMAHNLLFYKKFTEQIRNSIKENEISKLIEKYLPKNTHKKIKQIMGN